MSNEVFTFGETSFERHKRRIAKNREIQQPDEVNTETGWDCLDRRRKIMSKVLPGQDMSISFETALDTMENAEIFTRWEDDDKFPYKCVVRNLKDDWRRDEKFINAPLALGVNVGDTLTWQRLDMRWLVVWQDFIHRDYFRGEIHRASHMIRWKNKHGVIKEQWASVKGPVETRAKYEQTSGVVQNARQNDHIEILIGANDKENIEYLNRFKKIKVLSRTWRIHVVDDVSSPNIYRMSCVEDFNSSDTDDILELIPDGKIDFAQNEESNKTSEISVVGDKYVRKGIEHKFYVIDKKENILTDVEYEVEGDATHRVLPTGEILIKGTRVGGKVTILARHGEAENIVEAIVVSLLG